MATSCQVQEAGDQVVDRADDTEGDALAAGSLRGAEVQESA